MARKHSRPALFGSCVVTPLLYSILVASGLLWFSFGNFSQFGSFFNPIILAFCYRFRYALSFASFMTVKVFLPLLFLCTNALRMSSSTRHPYYPLSIAEWFVPLSSPSFLLHLHLFPSTAMTWMNSSGYKYK